MGEVAIFVTIGVLKKNITFSTAARVVFVPKLKTYKAIPAQNVSITKARENT